MAGELSYAPASGQLVYSPATGQLALNCISYEQGVPCVCCVPTSSTPLKFTQVISGVTSCYDTDPITQAFLNTYLNISHELTQTTACHWSVAEWFYLPGDYDWGGKLEGEIECVSGVWSTNWFYIRYYAGVPDTRFLYLDSNIGGFVCRAASVSDNDYVVGDCGGNVYAYDGGATITPGP